MNKNLKRGLLSMTLVFAMIFTMTTLGVLTVSAGENTPTITKLEGGTAPNDVQANESNYKLTIPNTLTAGVTITVTGTDFATTASEGVFLPATTVTDDDGILEASLAELAIASATSATFTVKPVAGKTGTATIEVDADGDGEGSSKKTLAVTVYEPGAITGLSGTGVRSGTPTDKIKSSSSEATADLDIDYVIDVFSDNTATASATAAAAATEVTIVGTGAFTIKSATIVEDGADNDSSDATDSNDGILTLTSGSGDGELDETIIDKKFKIVPEVDVIGTALITIKFNHVVWDGQGEPTVGANVPAFEEGEDEITLLVNIRHKGAEDALAKALSVSTVVVDTTKNLKDYTGKDEDADAAKFNAGDVKAIITAAMQAKADNAESPTYTVEVLPNTTDTSIDNGLKATDRIFKTVVNIKKSTTLLATTNIDSAATTDDVEIGVGIVYGGKVSGNIEAYSSTAVSGVTGIADGKNSGASIFEISLGTETMKLFPEWFTPGFYSIDGGNKWKKMPKKAMDGPDNTKAFSKIINKESTLVFSDVGPDRKTKKLPDTAVKVIFPKISARPKMTAKLMVNYAILSNSPTHTSESKWTLATKGSSAAFAGLDTFQIAAADTENTKVPGTWYQADLALAATIGSNSSIPENFNKVSLMSDENYVKKSTFYYRMAPVVQVKDANDGSGSTYTADKFVPASKFKKVSVSGQGKAPKYSIKKDAIKYKKNTVVVTGGKAAAASGSVAYYANAGEIKATTTSTKYNFFMAATDKKPASAMMDEDLDLVKTAEETTPES